jgi:hypothetical protein
MTPSLQYQATPLASGIEVELVVLVGRESGCQCVAFVSASAPAADHGPDPELWIGEKTGKHVIYCHPAAAHRTRDWRWSAGPPSPHDRAERLVFIARLSGSAACESSDWLEIARLAYPLIEPVELRGAPDASATGP